MNNNPWKEVALDDYENHMALSGVYQLQTLDKLMADQFSAYPVESAAVLGIAGGNGLGNLADVPAIKLVYGIDINPDYLAASSKRYPELAGRYVPVLADINKDRSSLPHADLVIANLFIEYVGYDNFAAAVSQIAPEHVSCVIQIDTAESFVSDSPYTAKLNVLDTVHSTIDADELTAAMKCKGYLPAATSSTPLPNGKIFRRLDFTKQ